REALKEKEPAGLEADIQGERTEIEGANTDDRRREVVGEDVDPRIVATRAARAEAELERELLDVEARTDAGLPGGADVEERSARRRSHTSRARRSRRSRPFGRRARTRPSSSTLYRRSSCRRVRPRSRLGGDAPQRDA